jgi:hypothetical protein
MRVSSIKRVVFVSLISFTSWGCGDESPDVSLGLEVTGVWATNFGTEEVITKKAWDRRDIVAFDNENNEAIVENPSDQEYYPGKFSKLVWTEETAGRFHYCTTAFGLETLEAAQSAESTANPSDFDGGCSDFSWTEMSAVDPN